MTTKQITLISSQSSKLGGYDLETTPYQKLKKDLEQFLIYQLSINESITIHTGAAAGIEQLWGLAAVVIKKKYPSRVKIIIHINHPDQINDLYKNNEKVNWNMIYNNSELKYVYNKNHKIELQHNPELKNKIIAKELDAKYKNMINHSDIVLSLYDGTFGSTDKNINIAKSSNKEIVNIDPLKYFEATMATSIVFLNEDLQPKSFKEYTYTVNKNYNIGDILEIQSNDNKSVVVKVTKTLKIPKNSAKSLKPLIVLKER